LIAAGIAKVVATNLDPNPLVAGQGFAKLRQAGVEVEVLPPSHPAAIASRELNIGFFSRMVRKTPWVRMKVATSLDGKTALPDGHSQWITSAEARTDGHAWRARACAILTGVGTVLQDNPRLDVRLVETPRQPHLVIVDSMLRTPSDAALFDASANRKIWIYAVQSNDPQVQARAHQLQERGADIRYLPQQSHATAQQPQVDLQALLHDLAVREVNELHVEAGQTLNGALVANGLVDELLLYLAPKIIGEGLGAARFGPLQSLNDALPLRFTSIEQLGPDLRVLARVPGRDSF
jgi:diaminohydroxyphosphoribosylaminopyrimidine deaminase/5-amino-6-(5-phosphoribosylamino)uracil reductase